MCHNSDGKFLPIYLVVSKCFCIFALQKRSNITTFFAVELIRKRKNDYSKRSVCLPSWERRVIFYDDGTFNSQDRFVNSKTGEWGAWSKLEKQTYSVESVTTSGLYYRVYINLTGYSKGQFVELYPHFMRHGGFYYEREDGTGDIWWKIRTRSSEPTNTKKSSIVPWNDMFDGALSSSSDETK